MARIPVTRLLLLLSLLIVTGCDMLDPAAKASTPRYVVESYLIAGAEFAPVVLRRTTDLDTRFHRDSPGVGGAAVTIHKLSASGAVDTTITFAQGREVGVYQPVEPPAVEPMTRYRLVVQLPGAGTSITASTTVPDTFSVLAGRDTISYRNGERLTYRTSASSYPGRQNIYLLDLQALDARVERLTPAAKRLMDGASTDLDTGSGYTIKDMRRAEWGPINEETYTVHGDQSVAVAVAWDKVAFFGPHRIDTYVIDDNLYEIMRSDAAQTNNAAPGSIPPVVDHVEGGTGVFAGMARTRYDLYISRP